MADLVAQQYRRNDQAFQRGSFPGARRQPGNLARPPRRPRLAAQLLRRRAGGITEFDPLTGEKTDTFEQIRVYANSHYVTPKPTMQQAINGIKKELRQRLDQLGGRRQAAGGAAAGTAHQFRSRDAGGHRRLQRDRELFALPDRPRAGRTAPTLFEFIPDNAIVFADESHVSVPQIGGMYRGDYRRKFTLAEHGFRLPSCMDNRPLKFEEWDAMRPQSVFVSRHAREMGDWNRRAASSPNR